MTKRAHVRKQYWNEPAMGLWERLYLPEILRGMAITSRVFFRNMGRWITGRKGALTTYYPEETRWDYARHNRGKHVLTQRPDGSPQCVACNMCATVCPAKVIEIDAAFDPDDPSPGILSCGHDPENDPCRHRDAHLPRARHRTDGDGGGGGNGTARRLDLRGEPRVSRHVGGPHGREVAQRRCPGEALHDRTVGQGGDAGEGLATDARCPLRVS